MDSVNLANLEKEKTAEILEIKGDKESRDQMETMGIIPGKVVRKISQQLFHGPITIEISGHQLALGYNMSNNIIVEIIQ